jgi:transposase-like protein
VSREARDRYECVEGEAGRQEYRNGFYARSLVTIFGTLVLRIARTRGQSFLPRAIARFQRRAGRGDAADPKSASARNFDPASGAAGRDRGGRAGERQTVSRLSRHLDRLVKAFQEAALQDEWAYWSLDGLSLRVRRPSGRKRVQMLVPME